MSNQPIIPDNDHDMWIAVLEWMRAQGLEGFTRREFRHWLLERMRNESLSGDDYQLQVSRLTVLANDLIGECCYDPDKQAHVTAIRNSPEGTKCILKMEYVSRLIDHMELVEARRMSRQAKESSEQANSLANKSIIVAVRLGIFQIAVAIIALIIALCS